MNPYRSGRAWLPAAVLSAVFAVTLIVLQLIFHFGYDDRYSPLSADDSVVEWLFVNNLGFWGTGAFDPDRTQTVIANLSAGAVLVLVVFVLAWLALRGTAPGSSALPAFFSAWLATMVAAPIASVVSVVIRSVDQDGFPFGPAISSSSYAVVYGLKWGWLAALVATVVWIAVRPRPGAAVPASTTFSEPDPVEDADRPTTATALPPPPTPRPAPPI